MPRTATASTAPANAGTGQASLPAPQETVPNEAPAAPVLAPIPQLSTLTRGVGYRTIKTMFGRNVPVVGTTGALEAGISWSAAGDAMLWARIEHAALRSGNGPRDRHVSEILGGARSPSLEVSSVWLPADVIDRGVDRGGLDTPGTIAIDGRLSEIELHVRFGTEAEAGSVLVYVTTTFAQLGIRVPRIGPFGLIATPQDALELFAKLDVGTVAGAGRALARAVRSCKVGDTPSPSSHAAPSRSG